MTTGEPRPPMHLGEMERKIEEEGGGRGPLGYQVNSSPNPTGKQGLGNIGQMLIPAVIAIALMAVMMMQYAPSKSSLSDVDDKVDAAFDRITAAETIVASSGAKVDTVVNTMGDYAKKDSLGGFATQSDLSAFPTKSDLSGLATKADLEGYQPTGNPGSYATKEDLTGLTTVLSTRMSELEAEVDALTPGGTSPGAGSDGALVANLPYSPFLNYPISGEGNMTKPQYQKPVPSSSHSVLLNLQNTSKADVKNPKIKLTIHSRGVPMNFAAPGVTGGWPLQWSPVYTGEGVVILQGSALPYSDFVIPAGGREDIYLTLELRMKDVGSLQAIPGATSVMLYMEVQATY